MSSFTSLQHYTWAHILISICGASLPFIYYFGTLLEYFYNTHEN